MVTLWYNQPMTLGEQSSTPAIPPSVESTSSPSTAEAKRQKRDMIIAGIIAGLLVLALIGFFIYLLLPTTDPELVVRFKNIFIIYLALETILIGAAIVILVIQIARFTNFMQHEVKPILDSTNETVNTVRGTTEFLSENLVEPTIKLNEYLASIIKLLVAIRTIRK